MMAMSPMNDLLAWWQNAKLRIRKYDVVVDERGEGQRIYVKIEDQLCSQAHVTRWEKSSLSTSWAQHPPSPSPCSFSSSLNYF